MSIETTMNIDRDVAARLDAAAARLGVTRRHLVSSLLGYAQRKPRDAEARGNRVRYQERREKSRWCTIHVSLRKDEYEFFIDLRKVMLLSVSFIIAWAIEQYLDELIFKMIKEPDNYRYRNYIIISTIVESVTCIVIYWGIPPNLLIQPDL